SLVFVEIRKLVDWVDQGDKPQCEERERRIVAAEFEISRQLNGDGLPRFPVNVDLLLIDQPHSTHDHDEAGDGDQKVQQHSVIHFVPPKANEAKPDASSGW